MTDTPHRRAADALGEDIDNLILAENDPKQRAFLIVLNSINKSLVANTQTIRDVSDRLDAHLTTFEQHQKRDDAVLNKGRGAWRAGAVFLGILQVVGVLLWNQAQADLSGINKVMHENQMRIVELITRVGALERRNAADR